MTVKVPDGETIDTKSKDVSGGKKMIYGVPGMSDEIKEKYEKENLNERTE